MLRSVLIHESAPPVGSVEVKMFPLRLEATHRITDGHDTSNNSFEPSTSTAVHAPAPPVGLVEVTTVPSIAVATHKETDGHDTPEKVCAGASSVTVHAPAPPVGSVEVTTFPTWSTATQSDAEGQDAAEIGMGSTKGAPSSTRSGFPNAKRSGRHRRTRRYATDLRHHNSIKRCEKEGCSCERPPALHHKSSPPSPQIPK